LLTTAKAANLSALADNIEIAEQRFNEFQRRATNGLPDLSQVWPEFLQEFQTTVEELRVAEEELRRQNALLMNANEAAVGEHRRYQELYDFAPDGYVVMDARGIIREANRAAVSLLRVQPRFLVGKPLIVFVVKNDRSAFEGLLQRLQNENEIRGAEIQIQPRRGRPLPVALYIAAVRDAGHRLIGLRCLLHDISSLKEAQRRMLQTERLAAIGQTVTALAHESRNALQRMQACLSMLALEVPDRPPALDLLARLQKAQDSLSRLFEDVREYAVPIKLERRLCNLREVWREAWAHLEPLQQHRDVELQDLTGDLDLNCLIDSFRLEQVFRNVLDNALAACHDPVRITITARATQVDGREAVELSIRDNGPGIPAEKREKVFEPFYTTKTRGTGLGMAIARRIIESHGGQIAVGDGDEKGADISITLPRGSVRE
jgi:PAS domain S-box-containing protein